MLCLVSLSPRWLSYECVFPTPLPPLHMYSTLRLLFPRTEKAIMITNISSVFELKLSETSHWNVKIMTNRRKKRNRFVKVNFYISLFFFIFIKIRQVFFFFFLKIQQFPPSVFTSFTLFFFLHNCLLLFFFCPCPIYSNNRQLKNWERRKRRRRRKPKKKHQQ